MGQRTQLERIIEIEGTIRVLTEEIARLRCDLSEHLKGFEYPVDPGILPIVNIGDDVIGVVRPDFPVRILSEWVCDYPGCGVECKSKAGLVAHKRSHGKKA